MRFRQKVTVTIAVVLIQTACINSMPPKSSRKFPVLKGLKSDSLGDTTIELPFHLNDANRNPFYPIQDSKQEKQCDSVLLNNLRNDNRRKRKIKQINDVKSRPQIETINRDEPEYMKQIGAFPEMQFPLTASDTWIPFYWNPIPIVKQEQTIKTNDDEIYKPFNKKKMIENFMKPSLAPKEKKLELKMEPAQTPTSILPKVNWTKSITKKPKNRNLNPNSARENSINKPKPSTKKSKSMKKSLIESFITSKARSNQNKNDKLILKKGNNPSCAKNNSSKICSKINEPSENIIPTEDRDNNSLILNENELCQIDQNNTNTTFFGSYECIGLDSGEIDFDYVINKENETSNQVLNILQAIGEEMSNKENADLLLEALLDIIPEDKLDISEETNSTKYLVIIHPLTNNDTQFSEIVTKTYIGDNFTKTSIYDLNTTEAINEMEVTDAQIIGELQNKSTKDNLQTNSARLELQEEALYSPDSDLILLELEDAIAKSRTDGSIDILVERLKQAVIEAIIESTALLPSEKPAKYLHEDINSSTEQEFNHVYMVDILNTSNTSETYNMLLEVPKSNTDKYVNSPMSDNAEKEHIDGNIEVKDVLLELDTSKNEKNTRNSTNSEEGIMLEYEDKTDLVSENKDLQDDKSLEDKNIPHDVKMPKTKLLKEKVVERVQLLENNNNIRTQFTNETNINTSSNSINKIDFEFVSDKNNQLSYDNTRSENIIKEEDIITEQDKFAEDDVFSEDDYTSESGKLPEESVDVTAPDSNIVQNNILENSKMSKNELIENNVFIPENDSTLDYNILQCAQMSENANLPVFGNEEVAEVVIIPEGENIAEHDGTSDDLIIPVDDNVRTPEDVTMLEEVIIQGDEIMLDNATKPHNKTSEDIIMPEEVVKSEDDILPEDIIIKEELVEPDVFLDDVNKPKNKTKVTNFTEDYTTLENIFIPEYEKMVVIPENNTFSDTEMQSDNDARNDIRPKDDSSPDVYTESKNIQEHTFLQNRALRDHETASVVNPKTTYEETPMSTIDVDHNILPYEIPVQNSNLNDESVSNENQSTSMENTSNKEIINEGESLEYVEINEYLQNESFEDDQTVNGRPAPPEPESNIPENKLEDSLENENISSGESTESDDDGMDVPTDSTLEEDE